MTEKRMKNKKNHVKKEELKKNEKTVLKKKMKG